VNQEWRAGGEGDSEADDCDWKIINVAIRARIGCFTGNVGIGDSIGGDDAGVGTYED